MEQDGTGASRRTAFLLLVAAVLAHWAAVFGLFGPRILWGVDPVIDGDLAVHQHRVLVLREAGAWCTLAWDPSYMGGAPVGGATDADNRLGQFGVLLLRFLPPGAAWNWTLLLLFALVPLLVHRAAVWAGSGPAARAIAAWLGVLLFWYTRAQGQTYLAWGMYGWVLAAAAAPLLFSGLLRVLERPGAKSALAYGAAVAFAGTAHALSALFLPLVALLFLARIRQVGARQLVALALAAGTAALLLLPSALPLLATAGEVGRNAASLSLYFQANLDQVVLNLCRPERGLALVLLLLAGVGLGARALGRGQAELAAAALLTAFLALFAWLFRFPPELQPTRFLLPALFLAVPAAAQVVARAGRGKIASVAAAALGVALALPHLHTLASAALLRQPLVTEPDAPALALAEHLRQGTSAESRILVEDDVAGPFAGDHFGAPPFVACLARRLEPAGLRGRRALRARRGRGERDPRARRAQFAHAPALAVRPALRLRAAAADARGAESAQPGRLHPGGERGDGGLRAALPSHAAALSLSAGEAHPESTILRRIA
ncbi:MAG: hypothetical protein HY812_09450 [Planctomycetes bacterium]|nr:hypothetical protein [Planctomycetota bacterium]